MSTSCHRRSSRWYKSHSIVARGLHSRGGCNVGIGRGWWLTRRGWRMGSIRSTGCRSQRSAMVRCGTTSSTRTSSMDQLLCPCLGLLGKIRVRIRWVLFVSMGVSRK